MTKFNQYLYYGVIISLLLVILFLKVNSCNRLSQAKIDEIALVNALHDTIRVFKVNDSISKATIATIQTSSPDVFTELLTADAQIQALQQTVKEYKKYLKTGSSVTNFESSIGVDKTTPTDYFTLHDTLTEYPVYRTSYKDEWLDYNVSASKDSTHMDFHIDNKYSVIIGYDNKKPFAEVTNYNPYSTTKTLRAFQTTIPRPIPKRWGIGVGVGVGVNSKFDFKPQINLGLSYNLINF